MKKISTLVCLFFWVASSLLAQEKPIKNVIICIPDGTSLAAVSAARWYQRYNDPSKIHLNLDPYLCGTILTYSSNAPIGDSAPTTSCYMTGYPSRAGWISTYPVADPGNDIIPMDSSKAYQPMITLMEAARIQQNKSVGLVVTCEFPHATPADCSAHSYNRGKYDWIAPQIAHNRIDVVLGGGTKILKPEWKADLEKEGYGVFFNDINQFRNYEGDKMWALFGDEDMDYDIDRNPAEQPSLDEMAKKAIEKLSQDPDGFVLMIEGSKVDWAAHANDAVALITDMVAFDKACGVAFDFAKQNGETLVVVVPDHGNSGFSIGSAKCPKYSTMSKDELYGPVSRFKVSADGLIRKLEKANTSQIKDIVYENTAIDLTDTEYNTLVGGFDFDHKLTDEERMKGSKLSTIVTKLMSDHTCFDFTTHGHTGEEVFLAVYDPRPEKRLVGFHTNVELNHYMREALQMQPNLLEDLTDQYFAKHSDVFAGYKYEILTKNNEQVLVVKNKKNTLEIRPYTNTILHNGKPVALQSVTVYVDKNNTFYLPQSLRELL
jgi:alkaline phosphatase